MSAETTFNVTTTIKAQLIADQIVTALEGGVGYWLESFTPKKGKELATDEVWYADPKVWGGDFEIEIQVWEESQEYTLTPDKIRTGLDWLSKNQPSRVSEILQENGDAETADVFLQACVFGDIVYG